MVTLDHYEGREQSYVKHVFLESYLERLVHKTASRYNHIVYVDGYAGPWQSSTEKLEDTSFGIALNALRRAKESWKVLGREVQMSAFLVERDAAAHKRLEQVVQHFPEITIKTYKATFLSVILEILKDIQRDAFAFFLIDPKGWRIPLLQLAPMLKRANSEVVFNFMFDFINRAASMRDPAIVTAVDELIPLGDWRSKLRDATSEQSKLSSQDRRAILNDAFTASLASIGNYRYVAETTILRPAKDRPLYSLFYATRRSIGLEVFRDSQIKAMTEQSKTRATTKVKQKEKKSGQAEIFQSLHEMAPEELITFLDQQRMAARQTLLDLTPEAPAAITFEEAWPRVLERFIIRLTDLKKLAADLRREGTLVFPDWERNKRVPQPHYRMHRAKADV
jgi:three-Cys-motif partner protein